MNPPKITTVLFDCDGTLVDSEYFHFLGWKKALVSFGSDLSLEEYYSYVGKSVETNAALFAGKVGSDCQARILEIKRESYRELCLAGVPAIEPAVKLFKELAGNKEKLGIKIGVCSAASKATLLFHMDHLEIEQLCDVILSGQADLGGYSDPEGVNKPKPYIYLHAMKVLGSLPQETIVIEDSVSGIAAAAAAGCFALAVPNDYTRGHDFAGAHLRLESLDGLSPEQFLQLPIKTN